MKLVPYIKLANKEKLGLRLKRPEEYLELYRGEEIRELLEHVPTYRIDPEKCRACLRCTRLCPAEAIGGGRDQPQVIDQEKCIKCGTCLEVCPPRFAAVARD
ncbi:MAG: indolepyruvate ferredoxin oxidoreductase subunit alpha [Moorellales bacterium]